jgi:hypothetical protein
MEAWKPIIITLLCVPAMALMVTVVFFWWQRHVSLSLASSYRLSRLGFWVLLAFGPLSVWLFLRENRPDYWVWGMIATQWVVGILRAVPKLRDSHGR